MSRKNDERFGATESQGSPAPTSAPSQFSFAVPTEFVDLPSKGRFYPEDHPLHNQETVEIKFMTAKEEDILTSEALVRKGVAIDRLLQSVLVNPQINVDDLLIGDKNAITVAARITGYGEDYKTRVACPSCSEVQEYEFSLEEPNINIGGVGELQGIEETSAGNYTLRLPKSNVDVEFRLLTGRDERRISEMLKHKKKSKLPQSTLTDQLRSYLISVNGDTNPDTISRFIQVMPAMDAKYLRSIYSKVAPNVDLQQSFECTVCGLEETMEVPFTTDFFWPRQ